MDTIPPSLWFRAIRATVAHITSSEPPNHVLDFMQEDIPPATTDPNDHNVLTNLWAQRIFTEEELSTLLESSLEVDIEPQYAVLTQQLNAINRKMWDVYRVSTFLVHPNNCHKHLARALITDSVEATNTGSTTIRTLIGELELRAQRRKARATRQSKGAQPANPPKIDTIPHTFSVGAWLLDAIQHNTRMRKTARKTTSNAVSQITIAEFFDKDNANDNNTKAKRFKDDKHALTSASIDIAKPITLPRTWAEFQNNPDQHRHHPTWDLLSPAEFYETVRECYWNEVDGHTLTATMRANEWVPVPPDPPHGTRTIYSNAFTTSSRTRSDEIAETINLIDETIAMCKPDIPGSISMIVDSGASHVLIRQDHAHVLQHVRQLKEFCNDQMRQTRSHPYGHRAISQRRATTLLTRP